MEIVDLHRHWEQFAREDPLWAILTVPGRKGRRWDPASFFATGVSEIRGAIEQLRALGIHAPRARALDFGCGVGRLSQALAEHFDRVDGVDISETMIHEANRFNRHGDRCRYHHNPRRGLELFDSGSFTFIYSNMVLQHIATEYAEEYLAEFARLLAPGGVLLFQVPIQQRHQSEALHENPEAAGIALPAEACRATITCGSWPEAWDSDTSLEVTLKLGNTSDFPWQVRENRNTGRPLALGATWRDADGKRSVAAAMVPLTEDVPAGGSVDVTFEVKTPSETGDWRLCLDIVQHQVRWFSQVGSQVLQLPLRILPSLKAACFSPVMEMNPVALDRIERILGAQGVSILSIQADEAAGPEFLSKRFVALKGSLSQTQKERATSERLRTYAEALAAARSHHRKLLKDLMASEQRAAALAAAAAAADRKLARLAALVRKPPAATVHA